MRLRSDGSTMMTAAPDSRKNACATSAASRFPRTSFPSFARSFVVARVTVSRQAVRLNGRLLNGDPVFGGLKFEQRFDCARIVFTRNFSANFVGILRQFNTLTVANGPLGIKFSNRNFVGGRSCGIEQQKLWNSCPVGLRYQKPAISNKFYGLSAISVFVMSTAVLLIAVRVSGQPAL